jgi:hypothetical protein
MIDSPKYYYFFVVYKHFVALNYGCLINEDGYTIEKSEIIDYICYKCNTKYRRLLIRLDGLIILEREEKGMLFTL